MFNRTERHSPFTSSSLPAWPWARQARRCSRRPQLTWRQEMRSC